MNDYALYIGAAYALTVFVLGGLVISSLRDWRKIKKDLEKTDA